MRIFGTKNSLKEFSFISVWTSYEIGGTTDRRTPKLKQLSKQLLVYSVNTKPHANMLNIFAAKTTLRRPAHVSQMYSNRGPGPVQFVQVTFKEAHSSTSRLNVKSSFVATS